MAFNIQNPMRQNPQLQQQYMPQQFQGNQQGMPLQPPNPMQATAPTQTNPMQQMLDQYQADAMKQGISNVKDWINPVEPAKPDFASRYPGVGGQMGDVLNKLHGSAVVTPERLNPQLQTAAAGAGSFFPDWLKSMFM